MSTQFINNILNSNPLVIVSYLFSISAIISAIFTLFTKCREWSIKLTAIFLISTIALISNNAFVYIASLFIIATLFTEKGYLITLIAIMRGDSKWLGYEKLIRGEDALPKEKIERKRSKMEYKILNTLWTKQVIYYPNFSKLWGFRLDTIASEYMEFREATNVLIGEGYIWESGEGNYFLTRDGIKFCANNYKTFPNQGEQYWPGETFIKENIETALKKSEIL